MNPKLLPLLFVTATLSAQSPKSESPNPLLNKIWRVTPGAYPNAGSIYIFLANGTLLETSCVETYRIATWKSSSKTPNTIEVTEDGRTAFTATNTPLPNGNLRMHRTFALGGKESKDLTLIPIEKEFTCPDPPK